jgi:hypothetical protein
MADAGRILFRRVNLRCQSAAGSAAAAHLGEVARRLLPDALDRALEGLDDGRIVVLRRVENRVDLAVGGDEMRLAEAWAASLAAEVRAAVARARAGRRGGEDDGAVVFDGPLPLLVAYVIDALGGRLDRWYWRPEAGALGEAQRALAALPGTGGAAHAYATAPPPRRAPVAAEAIAWALLTAGSALPELIRALHAQGDAAAALTVVDPEVAAQLAEGLAGPPARPARGPGPAPGSTARRVTPDEEAVLASRSGSRPTAIVAASIRRWPAAEPSDPRNVLLLLALTVAAHPTARGAAGLFAAAAVAIARSLAAPAVETLEGRRPPAPRAVEAPAPAARSAPPEALEAARATRIDDPPSPRAERSPRDPVADAAPRVAPPEDAATPSEPAPSRRPRVIATRFGGLFFLLHDLTRLAIPEAILTEPALAEAPGLGAVLYATVCRLCPAAWADPSALILAGADEPPPLPGDPLDAEGCDALTRVTAGVAAAVARAGAAPDAGDAAVIAAHGALLPASLRAAPWFEALVAGLALQLAGALRRRLLTAEPLDALLGRVVERAGELTVSPTHVDLAMPDTAIDLDVRRAALDVDPGWVPFLGKVVRFHYV